MTKHPTTGVELAHASHTEQPSVRRRDDRKRLQIPALVHSHGRFQTVVIDDFSSGGMQLQRCFGLGGRDEITVELLSGDRLPAKVAWSVGNRVGVSFLRTLSPEHPAMVALQQIAQRTPNASEHPEMQAQMQRALENNEFQLHYQPQICVADRRVTGVEALVRWLRPNNVTLLADQFIPLAEKTGLIVPLGDWVLRTACMEVIAAGVVDRKSI